MAAQAKNKVRSAINLSGDGRELLDKLKGKLGISGTAVLELAIREKAEREGLVLSEVTK